MLTSRFIFKFRNSKSKYLYVYLKVNGFIDINFV